MSVETAQEQMKAAVNHLREQLQGINALGLSEASLVDAIKVDCYGQKMPLKHVATWYTENRKVFIEPFDAQNVPHVMTALKATGYNTYLSSKTAIAFELPMNTLENRERILKRINTLGEEAKVSIRNTRKACRNQLKKEDLLKEYEKALQKATDDLCEQVDQIVAKKTALLKVSQ